MKDNNGAGLGGANIPEMANAANVVTLNEVNVGTINIIPGHTVKFSAGIPEPIIITNNNGIVLNIQGALSTSTITSFDDHFEIHSLGVVADEAGDL